MVFVCKFFGESLKENFGLSRKQHEREKSFQSSPIFTFYNNEETLKRRINAKRTHEKRERARKHHHAE